MNEEYLSEIKEGIFSVAIDDSKHHRSDLYATLIFIICRGIYIEHVIKSTIQVDGLDADEIIINTLSPLESQYQIILIHGITMGGLNIPDINKICQTLKKPVIAITENVPNPDNFIKAIEKLPDRGNRLKNLENAGTLYSLDVKLGKVFYYIQGISNPNAKIFLNKFAIRSKLPEQLLIAHKIASLEEK